MKNEDAMELKPEQKVIHQRYGVCIVQQVLMSFGELFGVVITPANQNGRDLLQQDCRCEVPDMLEDWPQNLSIEKDPAEPGYKPIDHETTWGISEKDMPPQEHKNHFAPEGEGVPE